MARKLPAAGCGQASGDGGRPFAEGWARVPVRRALRGLRALVFLAMRRGGRWRVSDEWGDALAGDGLEQPNRFPGGLADVSVVQEPVDGGGRQRFRHELVEP